MADEKIFEHEFDGEVSYEGVLADWIITKCQDWREHYESNYSEKHEEYYRLFRTSGAQKTASGRVSDLSSSPPRWRRPSSLT